MGEYNHLQDEFRRMKEQLEQKNQETTTAKTKEVDDLKAKLSDMQNERNRAKDNYGKEKQENEKCKSELGSESKLVQDKQQSIENLRALWQHAEKRSQKEETCLPSWLLSVIIA